jgi:hypothetical protein
MQNSARLKQLGIVDNYPYFRTSTISQGNNNTKQHSENSESAYVAEGDAISSNDDAEGDDISSNGTAKVPILPTSQSFQWLCAY